MCAVGPPRPHAHACSHEERNQGMCTYETRGRAACRAAQIGGGSWAGSRLVAVGEEERKETRCGSTILMSLQSGNFLSVSELLPLLLDTSTRL
jgi:hypothetical protein